MNSIQLRLTVALLPMIFLFSCGSLHFQTGSHIKLKQIQGIEGGKTTKADIKNVFGEPKTVGRDDAGLETWSYLYIDTKVPTRGGELKGTLQRLTLTFDSNIVKSLNYELSSED